jgi:hypothetical protein
MDAGCGLSTRGHWDGPVICNEAGQAVPASVAQHGESSSAVVVVACLV